MREQKKKRQGGERERESCFLMLSATSRRRKRSKKKRKRWKVGSKGTSLSGRKEGVRSIFGALFFVLERFLLFPSSALHSTPPSSQVSNQTKAVV
jgi:hypothetical protein